MVFLLHRSAADNSSSVGWTPLLGFIKDPPLRRITLRVHSRFVRRLTIGLRCHPQTCSAHVVPPDSSGLLHAALCRFVAPCIRPWGSPCFQPGLESEDSVGAFPNGAPPFEAFPSLIADVASPHWPPKRPMCSPHHHSLSSLLPGCPPGQSRVATVLAWIVPRSLDLRALGHQRVRCETPVLPPMPCPMLPWAFVLTCSG